jgi:aryl-alcohol dehydrogenase-like predicted oxidoreductase
MQQILLPGTDLQIARLGFGTASLHHALRSSDRQALLGAALDAGFTHFDTARMYGEGMAERELGRFLVGQRQDVTIATKFGIPAIAPFERLPPLLYAHRALGGIGRRMWRERWDQRGRLISPDAAEQSLASSLRALRTDWVDILFVHEPQTSEAGAVLLLADWLARQKTSGRVRYLGLAGNAQACAAIAQQTDGLFDVLQVEDSLTTCEADAVLETGRPLQITFGYLRQAAVNVAPVDGEGVIRAALRRNAQGMVLVSSRRPERLQTLAALAD